MACEDLQYYRANSLRSYLNCGFFSPRFLLDTEEMVLADAVTLIVYPAWETVLTYEQA